MKSFLKILFILIASLLLLPPISLAGQCRVIRVVDGDTIVVNCKCVWKGVKSAVDSFYILRRGENIFSISGAISKVDEGVKSAVDSCIKLKRDTVDSPHHSTVIIL